MGYSLASAFCVNDANQLGLNKAMTGQLWDQIKIKRTDPTKSGRFLKVEIEFFQIDPRELKNLASFRLYFPESQSRRDIHFHGQQVVEFDLHDTSDSYLNLLGLSADGYILFSATVTLKSCYPVIFDDTRILSNTRVKCHKLVCGEAEFRLDIEFDKELRNPMVVFQTTNCSIVPEYCSDGQSLTVKSPPVNELKAEMWMLCIGDAEQRFIAQQCFNVC